MNLGPVFPKRRMVWLLKMEKQGNLKFQTHREKEFMENVISSLEIIYQGSCDL